MCVFLWCVFLRPLRFRLHFRRLLLRAPLLVLVIVFKVGSIENPCGNEKVFCPLGSCQPTTVKPAFYAIGGSSRITRTAQQKCDIANHLQRQCPLGTVNSDFTCYATDLLTDEWHAAYATGSGRVNGTDVRAVFRRLLLLQLGPCVCVAGMWLRSPLNHCDGALRGATTGLLELR